MRLLIILTVSHALLVQVYSNEKIFESSSEKEKVFYTVNKDEKSNENVKDKSEDDEVFKKSQFETTNLKNVLPSKDEAEIKNVELNTHVDKEEPLIPEANTLKLRYATLTEEENKDNDYIKSHDDKSSSTTSSENNPRVFNDEKFSHIFERGDPEKRHPNFDDTVSTRTFYPRLRKPKKAQQDIDESGIRVNLGGYDLAPGEREDSLNDPTLSNPSSSDPTLNNPISSSEEKLIPKSQKDIERNQHRNQLIHQNVKHVHHQINPFISPIIRQESPNPRHFFRYSELPRSNLQNRQILDNSILGSTNWLEQLRNVEIGTYPSVMMSSYHPNFNPGLPLVRNDFPAQLTADPRATFGSHVSPSHQRISSVPIYIHHNPYAIPVDFERPTYENNQVYSRHPSEVAYSQGGFESPYLYPRPLAPVSSNPRNQYSDSLFNPFVYDSRQMIARSHLVPVSNSQTSILHRKDDAKISDNEGDTSESINQVQNPEGNENLYLNYPTTRAGYGTQEQLPIQNETSGVPIESENEKTGKRQPDLDELYKTFYNNIGQRDFSLEHPKFTFSQGNPFTRKTNDSDSSSESEDSTENKTKSFNEDDFYKGFQLPPQFNRAPHQVPGDHTSFFRFPVRIGQPFFPSNSNPFFTTVNQNENHTTSTDTPRPLPQQYSYFFNNYNNNNINEDDTPKCAVNSSSTICFEDAEYPRSEILQSLDAEAFLLLRILPPTTSDSSTPLIDDKSSNGDENSNICTSDIIKGHPLRAMNAQGKWKIVINLRDAAERFSQSITMENCRKIEESCNYTDQSISSRCVQKYTTHRLFVWNRDRGLHSDIFRLPVSCSCQIIKT